MTGNPYETPAGLKPPSADAMRQRIMAVTSMYVGYAMFMVLRMIPTVAGTSITSDPTMGVTTGDWGRILAMGTVGAVVGKFIGGLAADKLGGRVTFAIGLIVTAVGVFAFATSSSTKAFQASLFIALMAKSAGWPSMTKIIEATFSPKEYGRVWGVLSTSSRVGTLIATFVLGGLLGTLSWQGMLHLSAAIGVLIAIVFLFTVGTGSPAVSEHDTESIETPAEPHPLNGTTLPQAIGRFLVSRQFWLITFSLAALTIMWDFLLMVPLYLQKTMGMTESAASKTASAFPFGSLVSVLCGGYIFDRLSRRAMAWLMGGLLTTATLCVFIFYQMPNLNLAEGQPATLSLVLLFVFGLCVSPCYYIPMSVFSIEFGGPHSGFLIALLDALAFAANAAFYYYAGELAEQQGWNVFLLVLLGVCAFSAFTTWLFLLGEARKQTSAEPTTA